MEKAKTRSNRIRKETNKTFSEESIVRIKAKQRFKEEEYQAHK